MSRLGGFITQKVIEQGVGDIAAAGSATPFPPQPAANAAYFRLVRNASQAGGADPIAFISLTGEDTPDKTNSFPLYDGDAMWIYESEYKNCKLASADANQPTVHYLLYALS